MGKQKASKASLVAYIRVSTDEQANDGVSLAAQRVRIGAYAKALGYKVVSFESDTMSGKVAPSKRPGLARALDRVKNGEAAGVIVMKLDRLSRSTRHILDLADAAKRDGWQLLSVGEQLDTSSACGQFVLTLFGALAEMERKQIGERTVIGMAQIAREGRARSWRLPFGFRVQGAPDSTKLTPGDRRKLVKHPAEQKLLRQILALHAAGNGALRIANKLNERGAHNPRTAKPWSPSTLAGILRTAAKRAALATKQEGAGGASAPA